MSIDFNVFYCSRNQFSLEEFEQYAASLGFGFMFHPDCDVTARKGIVPIRLESSALSGDGTVAAYSTAFESYPNDYEHPPIRKVTKKTLLSRIFKRRKHAAEDESTPELSGFDLAVKDCDKNIFISSRGEDPLEILAAYIYGAYYCRKFGAVFDNPQIGRFYNDADELETVIMDLTEEFRKAAGNGQLNAQPFTEWGELPAEKPVIRKPSDGPFAVTE